MITLHDIFINPAGLINTLGLLGVFIIVFAESGLFFGFFLPGDSLLFTAGFLASQGYISIAWLVVGAFIMAVAGDSVGYLFGRKVGPAIFVKEDSLIFSKKHVARAQHFYEVHGKKTVILARFIPIVRTFAPIVAGVGNMNYRSFLTYNVVGALIWAVGVPLLGYFFGSVVPGADKYVSIVVILIVLTSFIPPILHMVKNRRSQNVVQ